MVILEKARIMWEQYIGVHIAYLLIDSIFLIEMVLKKHLIKMETGDKFLFFLILITTINNYIASGRIKTKFIRSVFMERGSK